MLALFETNDPMTISSRTIRIYKAAYSTVALLGGCVRYARAPFIGSCASTRIAE
jgi:hypothetical protein